MSLVVDILKEFSGFFRTEIPKFSRELFSALQSQGRSIGYENLHDGLVGNIFSSLLAVTAVGISVIVYVSLFFPQQLKYNLGTTFALAGLAIVTVNLFFAWLFGAMIHRSAKTSPPQAEGFAMAWGLGLSLNLFDFVLAILVPVFVLSSLDMYYAGPGGTNPLDIKCAPPSSYLYLGLVPIAVVRLLVWFLICRAFLYRSTGLAIRPKDLGARSPFPLLLLVSIVYAFVQGALMRTMLWNSIIAFDPC